VKFTENHKKAVKMAKTDYKIVVEMRIQEIRDDKGDAVTIFTKRRFKI
jgi:hypothetical protein